MFFKQTLRNASKHRKDNGLFFGSLIIAIVAFYTLLSLESQDVMRFLTTIESDAVSKLLMLIPILYVFSLFFVFFLVYFSYKYQAENRKKEFGIYLMLGMKRGRLFLMLFFETLWNSLISLLIGLPIALMLTEGISLGVAKLIGLGILRHQLSWSPKAILWTVCGFVLVQLASTLIIILKLSKSQPADCIYPDTAIIQKRPKQMTSIISMVLGIIFLFGAYALSFIEDLYFLTIFSIIAFGIIGTFLIFKGIGGLLDVIFKKLYVKKSGLFPFTSRQLQENIIYQYKSLAVCSLLLLMSLAFLAYGIAMVSGTGSYEKRYADFTIFSAEQNQIDILLSDEDILMDIDSFYPVYLSSTRKDLGENIIIEHLRKIEDNKSIVPEYVYLDYVISESSYNNLLKALGKDELDLQDNKVALFSSFYTQEAASIWNEVLSNDLELTLENKNYQLLPSIYMDNIVADMLITISLGLIVPDSLYEQLASFDKIYCWNMHLKDSLVQDIGLLAAVLRMQDKLTSHNLSYESVLGGIGRNLFYTVGSSYIGLYFGLLFFIIANTVIGMRFLIQLKQAKRRYRMLFMLGANKEQVYSSTKTQIYVFFLLALGLALLSGVFGVGFMFNHFTRPANFEVLQRILVLSSLVFLIFAVLEYIYINIIYNSAVRELQYLQLSDWR